MATKQEVLEKIDAISATVEKVSGETAALLVEIEDLKAAAEGNVSQDIVDKIDALVVRIKAVDDLVKDAATPDVPTE